MDRLDLPISLRVTRQQWQWTAFVACSLGADLPRWRLAWFRGPHGRDGRPGALVGISRLNRRSDPCSEASTAPIIRPIGWRSSQGWIAVAGPPGNRANSLKNKPTSDRARVVHVFLWVMPAKND